VALAAETELNAVMDQTDLTHPLADLGLVQQVDRSLLEHAGADPALHVLPAAALQDDRLDALQMQQLREQEARRSGPHDANLRAHLLQLLVVLARRSIQQPDHEQRD
jgi:hypothetical protein